MYTLKHKIIIYLENYVYNYYVYSGLDNSDRPHLVCYNYPRKTFEVDLLYMLN